MATGAVIPHLWRLLSWLIVSFFRRVTLCLSEVGKSVFLRTEPSEDLD